MPIYFAVPELSTNPSDNFIRLYESPATPVTPIALNKAGVNVAVYFSNPSGNKSYLFISYDEFNTVGSPTSNVDIYDVSNIASPNLINTLTLSNAACGMAIQPGTMDLYVATFTDDITNGAATTTNPGGVLSFTNASGYAQSSLSPFASFNDPWNDVADVCADLAFDPGGNLWMSTYTQGGSPSNHFLICFTQVDRNAGSSAKFFKLTNGMQISVAANLPGSTGPVSTPVYPLCEPHGIAFDPQGNLWLANNSDDSNINGPPGVGVGSGNVNGSLLRLDRNWIATNLLNNSALLDNLTDDGFGGTQFIPSAEGVSLYGFLGGRFGGLSFDGYSLYISDQSDADPFHQVVWKLNTQGVTSTSPPTVMQQSGLSTIYPGNTTIAIFNSTPAQLLIRDYPGDSGAEPDTTIPDDVMWESQDIGAVTSALTGAFPAVYTSTQVANGEVPLLEDYGAPLPSLTPCFAYVIVTNLGAANTGSEVLKLYWANSNSGLGWPAPWDGSFFAGLQGGGLIGAQELGAIPASGGQALYQFNWTTPDEADYTGHFCLLARIESQPVYPFGMDSPELTDVNTANDPAGQANLKINVIDNNKIAWRNLDGDTDFIVVKNPPIQLGVNLGNFSGQSIRAHLNIQTLNREGRPEPIAAKVVLHARGVARERLREAKCGERKLHEIDGGRFELHDIHKGAAHIHIKPREILRLKVEFTPVEGVHDFVVRAVQSVDVRGRAEVVGGQTFVFGSVAGFPHPRKK